MRHRRTDRPTPAMTSPLPGDDASVTRTRRLVRTLVDAELPGVASGETDVRWRTLFGWARHHDVGVARLAEAHVDAQGILAEAGEAAPPVDSLTGVWASAGDGRRPVLCERRTAISGTVSFCSGIGVVDRALVAVEDHSGAQHLAEVKMRDVAGAQPLTVTSSLDPWETPALRSTRTGTVHFRDHPVERIVGAPDWYLHRPGFWHAAIGPAACWAGAAAAFLDDIDERDDADPHRLVARGAMRAEVVLASAVLDHAGCATDAEPFDADGARYRAFAGRHLIERSCARLLDAYERAWGPRPFVGSAASAQRAIDLRLYLRQHHGDRDLAMFGALTSQRRRSGPFRAGEVAAS